MKKGFIIHTHLLLRQVVCTCACPCMCTHKRAGQSPRQPAKLQGEQACRAPRAPRQIFTLLSLCLPATLTQVGWQKGTSATRLRLMCEQ